MQSWLLVAVLVVVAAWIIYLILRRDSLAQFDQPPGQLFRASNQAAQAASASALEVINQRLRSSPASSTKLSIKQRIPLIRHSMENFFAEDQKHCVSSFTAADAGGVPAEWVVAPAVDPGNGRRFLYIHGGAFMAGSPKSHRIITSKLSEITDSAVLSIDYRLIPENSRMAGVEDCRTAYQWLLAHGLEGEAAASCVMVAGDSAGGNLTLSLLAWLRDSGERAPDAALALSPVTDLRFSSPSILGNLETDVMLRPLAHRLTRLPRWLISVGARIMAGHSTKDPVYSPLLGDLSNLPPILVIASEHEILRDDGRRYANKAAAAGTQATYLGWANMPHVWPIFYPSLPEAGEAFEQIEAFFNQHT